MGMQSQGDTKHFALLKSGWLFFCQLFATREPLFHGADYKYLPDMNCTP